MDILKRVLDFFFSPMQKTYGTGALESPVDTRNIALASFQAPVTLPEEYETPLPPIEDQGRKGKCVGSAIHKGAEFLLTPKGGIWIDLSDDDLFEQCKTLDGIPEVDGTYPSVGAYVATKRGIATVEAYNSGNPEIIAKSRAEHKLSGYAWVFADFEAICQAIYQNKFVTASFAIDKNWYKGKLIKVLKILGRHYVILNGFKLANKSLKGQNSWGIRWIGYIAGKLNKAVKEGCFELGWEDYADNITDIISFTFIPPEILEEVKDKEYRFTKDLRFGDSGFEVQKLQERLKKEGYYIGTKIDGKFGSGTRSGLIAYQGVKGLKADGIFGIGTRTVMNQKSESSIALWARAIQNHEGYLNAKQSPPRGSRSFRNNSPANFKVGSKLTDYMKKLGGTGLDPQGFVIFPSYEVGFKALCSFLEDACNDKLTSYKGSMTILQFFEKYAPSADDNDPLKYAQTVAKQVGATIDTKIRELI